MTSPINLLLRQLRFGLVFALMGGLLALSLSELNPDWFSYQLIYESSGAWLAETGRDPAFIWLIGLMVEICGADGYEDFRLLLSIYFLTFSVALVSGSIITYFDPLKATILTPLVAVMYLGLTRFTIQIREGIAISIALFAVALLMHIDRRSQRPLIEKRGGLKFLSISGWILLLMAGLVHASVLFLLIATIIAWVSFPPDHKLIKRNASEIQLTGVWGLALVTAFASATQAAMGGALERLASSTIGDRLAEDRGLTPEQAAFWLVYGGVCFLLWKATENSTKDKNSSFRTYGLMRIIAGPFIISIYLCIVLSLAMKVSSLIITNYVRLLHFFLAVICILLALKSSKRKTVLFCSLFLIADQIRSIAESISIYFGIDLL